MSNVGFVRKVQHGMLKIGKKFQHTLVQDQHVGTKIRHFNRRFIRDYIHSFPFDRELQQFVNGSNHYDLAPFSYFDYTIKPTEQQLQWLAGFTEHFCSFKVQYTPKDHKFAGKRYHPILRLFYVGSCFPLLKYIANWYNGKIIQYHSGHWGLVLSSTKAVQLLVDIYPYCIVKKRYIATLLEFIALYKCDTKLFTTKNSFEEFSGNMLAAQQDIGPLEKSILLNYLGGFYDAKGNVQVHYNKRGKITPQLNLFSQCKPFLEYVQEVLQDNSVTTQLHYYARDNVYSLHSALYNTIINFLQFIYPLCVYKRVFVELWQTWLPVFKFNTARRYTHILQAIQMYWLFLQYGIELNNEQSLF